MTIDSAETLLAGEEGRRNDVYPDQFGYPTCGIGHKAVSLHIGNVYSDAQVDAWFNADFAKAVRGVTASLPWFARLDAVRQAYFVSMAFQMGLTGLLGFHHTLAAAAAGRWDEVAQGIRSSDWHTQTPARAERAADAMVSGQWQQIP